MPRFLAGVAVALAAVPLVTAPAANAAPALPLKPPRNPDGTPLFGIPVGDGGPIVRLSPADHPQDFVRHHDDSTLHVERSPRDVAAIQFRFLPSEDGTESVQSVDHPTRYAHVVGTQVTLDTTPTPFYRITTRTGIKLESAGLYLRATGSAITMDPKATTFRLS